MKRLTLTSFILVSVLSLLCTGVSYTFAAGGTDPLTIDVNPSAPAPGESTTVTLNSIPIDLGKATISWAVNGSPSATGAGIRSFTFTMGPSSEATVVSIDIKPIGGAEITRTLTFHPGSVTLLWEAATYTPPWYRGKALYSPGSDLRILAVPAVNDQNGTPIPPESLVYKWQINGDPYADRSGLGKDTLYLTGSQLQEGEDIAVDIVRTNGIRAAHAEITVPASTPLLRVYVNDPLRGVRYNQALGNNVTLTDTETTLIAEPYFISGAVRQPARAIFTWKLNDQDIAPQGTEQYLMTLRQTNGQTGQASLNVSVQNADLTRLLQQAQASFTLLFGVQ